MKFQLGQVVTTRAIREDMNDNTEFTKNVQESLAKYVYCNWGETHKEDCKLNDEAVRSGERILAVYETCLGRIWIITEWDRSATTILYPSEY